MPSLVWVAGRAMIVGMRYLAVALALVSTLVATSVLAQAPRVVEPEQSRPWAAYFSPGGGAAQAVVEAVGRARHSVLVQAAALSSPPITKALVDAQHRGVKVEVILDRKHAKGRPSSADALVRDGVMVLIDRAHPANSNVMVIDAEVVVTGSFAFTVAADRESAENLLVIHAPTLAARFGENWQAHAAHSVRYTATTTP
jgi:phosphatidylserine/phosphatidylglycerophosphate/cardiolipin synthase-like enzyme